MQTIDNKTRIRQWAYKQFERLERRDLLKWISDELYLKLRFWLIMGYKLNLNEVETFNEKLQWLKLNDRKLEYTPMVDKYEVRKYISEIIGNEYLIPLIGIWDKFEDIEFEKLPNQFVLKCTHDSGGLIVCKDKAKLDISQAKKKIDRCLNRNYYYHGREWPYKNVKPRIICEKYIVDESGTELKDYKFMCFNGKVKCLLVCLNRNMPDGLKIDFYDKDWNLMLFERFSHRKSGKDIPKPKTLNMMIELSEKLSSNIPFVRVDFYEVDGKLYFGELTFFPGSGFEKFVPETADYELGSWLELPYN